MSPTKITRNPDGSFIYEKGTENPIPIKKESVASKNNNKIEDMTINKAEVVTIRKWVLIFVAPFVISGLTAYAAGRFNAGKQEKINEITIEAIKINAESIKELRIVEIKDLQDKKANVVDMDKIYNSLIRIEAKFDQHIVGKNYK